MYIKNILLATFIGGGVILTSCSDPAKNASEESSTAANSRDSSSSNQEFNLDTTIDMNSGGGTGSENYKADTLSNNGKASGGE